ncbi:hypothetical protein L6452_16941 [Arctium lappa]|uniref:Uncharacterized protein n=1 Tax=Arctium lappa TaxID=4217 RepID=A0ACB9C2B7_ARCLA|nr:hypothetical protein L6452_16941 [Arctium lappa]
MQGLLVFYFLVETRLFKLEQTHNVRGLFNLNFVIGFLASLFHRLHFSLFFSLSLTSNRSIDPSPTSFSQESSPARGWG